MHYLKQRAGQPSSRPIESLERRVLLAAGALDPTFGSNGIVLFNNDMGLKLRDAAVQADGKIIALFSNGEASSLARFNVNGSLDTAFGSGGRISDSGLGDVPVLAALALQSDGKVVAAGNSGSVIGATRFTSNGSIDKSFGSGGHAFTSNSDLSLTASDLLVRPDDRILIGGSAIDRSQNHDFALFALAANGGTDDAFAAPVVVSDFSGNLDSIEAIALLADGRIIASGISRNPVLETGQLALALYNADGTAAAEFSGDGQLIPSQVSASAATLLAVRGGNKIVLLDPTFGPNGDQVAAAQFTTSGLLDTSFSGDGIVAPVNDVPIGRQFTGAIAIDPTGLIVIAYDKMGTGASAREDAARLVRLNVDGSIDPSFNDPGALSSAGFVSGPNKLLPGPNKTLVLATSITNNDLVLARYDATRVPTPSIVGSPATNTTASTIGIRVTYTGDVPIDPASVAVENVRLTGPGRYSAAATAIVGLATSENTVSVTYVFDAPGGTLEPADNGRYSLLSQANGVKDVNGNLVPVLTIGAFDLAVAESLPDLAFADTGFTAGTYGPGDPIASTLNPATAMGSVSSYDVVVALSVDAVAGNNDDIPLQTTTVTTGSATIATLGPIPQNTPAGDYFLVARIDPAGAVAEIDELNNILVSSTAAITVRPPPSEKPSLRIGGLDPSFGAGGVIRPLTFFSSTVGALEQPGGTIIIAGSRGEPGNRDIGLTRRIASGAGDSTWGDSGVRIADLRGTDDHVVDFKVLADGSILVAGTSTEVIDGATVGADFFVVRFDANGNRDMTFGDKGRALVDFAADAAASPSTDTAREMLITEDGRIVIVGRTDAGGDVDFAVARLTANGALDATFGIGGRVTTDFGGGDDGAQAVALSGGGSIVVAGYATDAGSRRVALARYLQDGVLDRKFGVGGTVTATSGGADERANSVTISSKGHVLVAGYSTAGSVVTGNFDSDLLVARFNARGKLDKKFDGDGIATVSLADPTVASHVEVLPAGQILVSGVSSAGIARGLSADFDLAVARFTDAGTLDSSFGVGGIVTIPSNSGTASAATASTQPLGGGAQMLLDLSPADALDTFQNTAEGKILNRQGGGAFIAGTSGDQTLVAALITSGIELSGELLAKIPTSVVGGTKGSAKVNVVNLGDTFADGTVDILFFTSLDQELNSGDRQFFGLAGRPLKLKPLTLKGKPKKFSVKFAYPEDIPDGTYFLLAQVNAVSNIIELDPNNNAAFTNSSVQIKAPVVDLNGPALPGGIAFNVNKPTTVPVTLGNSGTVPLKAAAEMTFVFSADDVVDDADARVGSATVKLNLKPQSTRAVKVKLTAPTLEPGSYFLFVLLDPLNVVAEKDEANNLLSSMVPSTFP